MSSHSSTVDEGDDSKQQQPQPASADEAGYEEPDYDIGDVRRALKQLYKELQEQQQQRHRASGSADAAGASDIAATSALNATYCSMLGTLSKVSSNLLHTPPNPSHLQLNLRSAAVLNKFAAHAGARALLKFLGFEERLSAEAHTLSVPAASLPHLRQRIERAIVIMAKVREEHTPPPQEMEDVDNEASTSANAAATSASSDAAMEDVSVSVAAPASVFLANTDTVGESGAGGFDASPSPPPDEEMRPNLNPTYDIAEVRAALRGLYSEIEASMPSAAAASASSSGVRLSPFDQRMRRFAVRESFVSVLDTLGKVTANVLRRPVNPAHLRINLANAAVSKKFGQYKGAVQYLNFLGFKETTAAAAAVGAGGEEAGTSSPATAVSAPVTPSNSSGGGDGSAAQLLVLPESDLSDPIKLQRALSILQQQRAESALSEAEQLQRTLGPISRSLRVFDVNTVAPSSSASSALRNPLLPPAHDDGGGGTEDSRGDLALVMAASAVERKRVADMSRTDVIITKTKQAEIKEAGKRKYEATLIKITFSEKKTVQAPQQGSGRFGAPANPNRLPGGGYKLGGLTGKYGANSASATPMEQDDDEEKKSSGAPPPVAMPVTQPAAPAPAATAAASSSVSPLPAVPSVPVTATSPQPTIAASSTPASPPPAELLLTAYFRPWETLGDVFHWLQSELLVHGFSTDPFYLHLPPSSKFQCGGEDKTGGKLTENTPKTLQSLGMVPAAAMMFHYCAGSSAADVPGAALASLREEVRMCAEPYDGMQIASLMPEATNKAELEAQKAKLIAEMKGTPTTTAAHSAGAAAAGSKSMSLGADDDDDGDIEAYMRRKKAALASKAGGKPVGGSASSSSSGSAAGAGGARPNPANRNIPGLFKPRGS